MNLAQLPTIVDLDRIPVHVVSSSTEARQALRQIRRERPPVALLQIHHPQGRKSLANFPTVFVDAGTVLIVEVRSGMAMVKVAGGRVVYRPRSSWGNSLEVTGGTVHIDSASTNIKTTLKMDPETGCDILITANATTLDPEARFHGYIDGIGRIIPNEAKSGPQGIPASWLL